MNRKRTYQKFISYFECQNCESAGARSAGCCSDPASDCNETDTNQNGDPDGDPELTDENAREAPSPFPHAILHDPEHWREYYGRLPGHVMPDVSFRNGCLGAFRKAEAV